jgi:hypothetical protein
LSWIQYRRIDMHLVLLLENEWSNFRKKQYYINKLLKSQSKPLE